MNGLSQSNGSQPFLSTNGDYPIYRSFPENGSENVSTKAIPKITFSEPMQEDSLNSSNLLLFDSSNALVDCIVEIIASSSVCLKPRVPMKHEEKYTIRFGVGLRHADGKTLDLSISDIEFTTI